MKPVPMVPNVGKRERIPVSCCNALSRARLLTRNGFLYQNCWYANWFTQLKAGRPYPSMDPVFVKKKHPFKKTGGNRFWRVKYGAGYPGAVYSESYSQVSVGIVDHGSTKDRRREMKIFGYLVRCTYNILMCHVANPYQDSGCESCFNISISHSKITFDSNFAPGIISSPRH